MHDFISGPMPMHAIGMCVLFNIALVLSIAALLKYLIKGRGCGCNCKCACCHEKGSDNSEATSCCKNK
jgi:hypothetical protein